MKFVEAFNQVVSDKKFFGADVKTDDEIDELYRNAAGLPVFTPRICRKTRG